MFKVMIVDDMEVLRRDVKRLKLWGDKSGFIITEEAKDGLEALKKLEENPVDLVITDIRMPNMDGIELLKNIFERKLCPFAVLLSDYTEYGYARQGFLYGAFDYIGKPADEKELGLVLERIHKGLVSKRLEERRLVEMQEFIEGTLFTATDIKRIVQLISQGDLNAIKLIEDMVESIGNAYNYDISKAMVVLKNAVAQIINGTLEEHIWITRLELGLLKDIDLASTMGWAQIKKTVASKGESLIIAINKFIGCHDNNKVKQVCNYVLEHAEEELSVKAISERLYISKSYLSEIFRNEMGVPLLEYINMVKMEYAKKLLRDENLKNYEVAYKLGFKDNEYFSKVFKRHIGMPPSEFRQKEYQI